MAAVGGQSLTAPTLQISTGAVRGSGKALPVNAPVQGTISTSSAPDAPRQAANDAPSRPRVSNRRQRHSEPAAAPETYSAKDAPVAAPEIVYDDPGKFQLTLDAGWANKHLWRGIDLAQFTSFNHLVQGRPFDNTPFDGNPPPPGAPILPKPDSDVVFAGVTTTYKGFAFGMKYITTLSDEFNPFFAPSILTRDNYSELVATLNYTRMLVGDDLLEATAGFDFYYYPNGEFWGVDHQGMVYARFSSPHYKWAQPFIELFYNVATDSDGNGIAKDGVPGGASFRGAAGSDLVEGGGFELGVEGGDRIFGNDKVSVAFTYSLSTFYKSGYAFEDDGFSHVSATVATPVTIGSHFTITPAVTYVEAVGDISPKTAATATGFAQFPGGGSISSAWNEPGWVASVKASWAF